MDKNVVKEISALYSKRKTVENVEKFILEEIFEKRIMTELGYEKNIYRIVPEISKKGYYIQNMEKEEQKIGLLITNREINISDERALLNLLAGTVEWGFITNGQYIVLVNGKIETSKLESWKGRRIVLEVKLNEHDTISCLRYFTKDELFISKNAQYFKDIAEYKNTLYRGNEESWPVYNSSLKRFFLYYIEKYNGTYDGYEKFEFADFVDFISKQNVHSPATIVNIYSHISVYLRDKIGLRKNGFELSRKDVLKVFTGVKREELGDILDPRRLMKINEYFLSKKNHQIRNLTIFYLGICYGIERRQICQLCWKDIPFEKETITLGNIKKPLPKQLVKLLSDLRDENKKKGYPNDYVFYVYRNGKARPITKDAVNNMFSSLAEIDSSDPVYTQYSPAKIRRALAGILLKELPLEQVMYLLSIEAENLGRYLTSAEIFGKAEKKINTRKKSGPWHPMEEVLEGVFEKETKGGFVSYE